MGNPIDIICVIVVLSGFYYGYTRGIIGTVLTVLGYVLGVIFAFKLIPLTTSFLQQLFNNENPLMAVAAFITNVAVIMFLLRLLANGIEGILNAVYLGMINRLAGGAMMGLFSAMIFAVLLWFANKAQLIKQETLEGAATYKPFLEKLPRIARSGIVRLKPFLTEAWDDSIDWMDRIEKFGVDQQQQPKVYELPEEEIEKKPQSSSPNTPPDDNSTGIED